MNLNRESFRARMRTDFDKRFGGPLVSITKEFEVKGITPTNHMLQPPPTPFEIQIGGTALCEMVYALRQKEGIPDPHIAEQDASYRTSAPCLGIPGQDDPFPKEHSAQVGTRAIDMAETIQEKSDRCIGKMGHGEDDALRRAFVADIQRCCLEQIRNIHYSILSRCPTAQQSEGEAFYNRFIETSSPGFAYPAWTAV
jgi:hypothetical protein